MTHRPKTSRSCYNSKEPKEITNEGSYCDEYNKDKNSNFYDILNNTSKFDNNQKFTPHPPAMPQREETFLNYHSQNHSHNISPRRRMYIKQGSINSHEDLIYNQNHDLELSPSLEFQQRRKSSINIKDPLEIINNEPIERPISSRLSKFSLPLPPISSKQSINNNEECPIISTTKEVKESSSLSSTDNNNNNNDSIVLIAIRLPNGKTIKNNFLKKDTIKKIINYAATESNIDLNDENFKLLEMPKKIISDFNKTIEYYGLENRTMLHIINS